MRLDGNDLAALVDARFGAAHAEHERHRRAVDVEIDEADAQAVEREARGEIGGDRALADAALAARDGHEVAHALGDARRAFARVRSAEEVFAERDRRRIDGHIDAQGGVEALAEYAAARLADVAGEGRSLARHDDGESDARRTAIGAGRRDVEAADVAEAHDVTARAVEGIGIDDAAQGVEDEVGGRRHGGGRKAIRRPP